MTETIQTAMDRLMTTAAEPQDYVAEDGLLYCGSCNTPKEAFFPNGRKLFGRDRHPAECLCRQAVREKQEAEEKARLAVSNLVNNMYSRDIAKKIRAALETNWKNGKATCTNVPFGYVWNKKGGRRWEIDPEAAVCVKKVFELALSGRNTTQIAYGMNELNLPTPGLYAKRKNLLRGSNPIIAPDSEMLWNAAIV